MCWRYRLVASLDHSMANQSRCRKAGRSMLEAGGGVVGLVEANVNARSFETREDSSGVVAKLCLPLPCASWPERQRGVGGVSKQVESRVPGSNCSPRPALRVRVRGSTSDSEEARAKSRRFAPACSTHLKQGVLISESECKDCKRCILDRQSALPEYAIPLSCRNFSPLSVRSCLWPFGAATGPRDRLQVAQV